MPVCVCTHTLTDKTIYLFIKAEFSPLALLVKQERILPPKKLNGISKLYNAALKARNEQCTGSGARDN